MTVEDTIIAPFTTGLDTETNRRGVEEVLFQRAH